MPEFPGGIISVIHPRSLASGLDIEPGDQLLSVNGHPLRDIIDFQYHSADEQIELILQRERRRHSVSIVRSYGADVGLEFVEPIFDGLRQCSNNCRFCFVKQMHPGLRQSLYLRDDDYRFSFLSGSFITLTNLDDEEWRRIREQHLSPLYVSIHATDLTVRRRMLGNPSAPDILDQLRQLARAGIEVHGQIVIVPEVNDGNVLRRTVGDLLSLWPSLRTVALVPVGVTRFHRRGVRTLTSREAVQVLDLARSHQTDIASHVGRTWLYPSDELYLLAGQRVPKDLFYDDDAQRENGVGLVRELLDDWQATCESAHGRGRAAVSRITLVCGTLIAPVLREIASELEATFGIEASVVPVVNRFFGETVTVSGLLAGADVISELRQHDSGQHIFVPRAMFDHDLRATLDDVPLARLIDALGVPTTPIDSMSEIITACMGR